MLFIRTHRKDNDSLNDRVFIQGIEEDYMGNSKSNNLLEQQNQNSNIYTKQNDKKFNSDNIEEVKQSKLQINNNSHSFHHSSKSDLNSSPKQQDIQDQDQFQADEELIKYIQEMIEMLNTDDEELNNQNKQLLVQQISKKLEEQKIKPDVQQIEAFLDELKNQQFSKAQTAEEKRKLLNKMTEVFYNLGYMSLYAQSQSQNAANAVALGLQGGSIETLSAGLLSKTAWIAVAFVYTAQTGLNYRRYKKGTISKKEFWHRVRLNSVTTVSSVAGGSGGAAAGFAIGTAMFPGVGSIVGAVVGGIAGGFAGEKLSAKAYKSIEKSIAKAKEKKRLRELQQKKLQQLNNCRISEDRYEQALALLAIPCSSASMLEIEDSYMHMLEVLTVNKSMDCNKDVEVQKVYVQKYQQVIDAYEDIRDYRRCHKIYY